MTRPTAHEVAKMARDYYDLPNNGAGGNLHIVLDDGNLGTGSIAHCLERAKSRGDEPGILLAEAMLKLTPTQRRNVMRNC